MSDVGVRLTGDNSEFIAMLKGSADKAGQFSGEIAGKVGGKLTGMRDLSTAVATALGINIQNIAENVARAVTGMSKETEDMLKRIEALSTQNADASLKNMRSRASEETKYLLALKEKEKQLKIINDVHLGEVDAVEYVEDALLGQIAVIGKVIDETKRNLAIQEASKILHAAEAEIIAYEVKQREAANKKAEEAYKARAESNEKEYQAQLSLLNTAEQVEKLKNGIASMEAAILLQLVSQKDAELLTVAIKERKNLLVAAQTKLEKEAGEVMIKNAEAEADAMDKRIDIARAELPLAQQKEELLENLKTVQRDINNGLDLEFDVTKDIKRETELKAKIKEIDKKQGEANVEIAKILLKGEQNLTAEDKLRLQVLQGQTTEKKIQDEIAAILAKGAESMTAEDKARLAVLVGQTGELHNQLKALAEMNAAAKEFVQTISRKGTAYEGQSSVALEGNLARIKQQLDQVARENAMVPVNQRNPMEIALRSEFEQLTRELSARANIGNFANQFGEDAARFKYGDTLTDRALRETRDAVTRTATTLEDIQARLAASGLFPKK